MRPEAKAKDQIGETILLEQYLRMLHPDLRIWVKENQPQTGEETASLAKRYMEIYGHTFLLQMRDQLEKFRNLAKENLHAAQKRQKVWYNTHARERYIKPRQKVIVLLPSGNL